VSRHSSSPPITRPSPNNEEAQVFRAFAAFLAAHPQADEQRKLQQACRLAVRWSQSLTTEWLLRRLADNRPLLARPLDHQLIEGTLAADDLSAERLLREMYLVDLVCRLLEAPPPRPRLAPLPQAERRWSGVARLSPDCA